MCSDIEQRPICSLFIYQVQQSKNIWSQCESYGCCIAGKNSSNWLNIKIPSEAPMLLLEKILNNLLKSNEIASKLTQKERTLFKYIESKQIILFYEKLPEHHHSNS